MTAWQSPFSSSRPSSGLLIDVWQFISATVICLWGHQGTNMEQLMRDIVWIIQILRFYTAVNVPPILYHTIHNINCHNKGSATQWRFCDMFIPNPNKFAFLATRLRSRFVNYWGFAEVTWTWSWRLRSWCHTEVPFSVKLSPEIARGDFTQDQTQLAATRIFML